MSDEPTLRVRRDENGAPGQGNEDSASGEDRGSSGERSENEINPNDMDYNDIKEERASILKILGKFAVCLVVGIIFGFVLEKGRGS